MDLEILLTVLMGIALSAASGFRVFVPFLVISIAAYTGNLNLSESFAWMGTLPAVITFSAAAATEILGYLIPWFDNLLDMIASPAAVIAGIILTASVVMDISPLLKWTLAIIGGGGAAAAIQAFTGITRAASTTVTGGAGNPLISTAEAGGSLILSLLALLAPLAAGIAVIVLLMITINKVKRKLFSGPAASK